MQVKICGLKDAAMMAAALDAGADMVGLVFFPKSPRHVTLEAAQDLAMRARGRAKVVALMVAPDDDAIGEVMSAVRPDYLQLHGGESAARVAAIKDKFRVPIIKAIGVASADDVVLADGYQRADIILFDAKADPSLSELPGGNGIPFDWRMLKGQKEKRNFMLSGGLTPGNVAEAISLTGAALVDVSSGVETAPGQKQAALIEAFIRAAKMA